MTKLTEIHISFNTPSEASAAASMLEDVMVGPVNYTDITIRVSPAVNAVPRDLIKCLEDADLTIADWHSHRSYAWTIEELIDITKGTTR